MKTDAPQDQTAPRRGARSFDLFDDQMPIRRYKLLLQSLLQRRGRGIGQTLADATGTNRSFVSQMTSPAYDVPLPTQHVRTIIDAAGFTAEEEWVFLEAYVQAHPERAVELFTRARRPGDTRKLVITVPVLASEQAQRRLEAMIERLAAELAATAVLLEQDLARPGGAAS